MIDFDNVATVVAALVVGGQTALTYLAKQHAKEASTQAASAAESIGPTNGETVKQLLAVIERESLYQHGNNHAQNGSMTRQEGYLRLLCMYFGIDTGDVDRITTTKAPTAPPDVHPNVTAATAPALDAVERHARKSRP